MILNEIPIKTTNGFNVNNLKINLDLPDSFKYHEYKSNIKIKYKKTNLNSLIGLDYKEALDIEIIIDKVFEKPIELIYEFKNSDSLINRINVHYLENSKSDIIFTYKSLDQTKQFNYIKFNIIMDKYSNGNINIINLLNNNSTNIIASESNLAESSYLKQNLIDIGGNIRIYNFSSKVNSNAKSYLNNIYLGNKKNLIDMNYNYQNIGENSLTNIKVEGVLDEKATKTFRGTIDFNNSNNASGKELENCLLLSDDAISKSVPILLCNEENVVGSHAVSTGKIDNDKLFYLMSRGFSLKDAKKLIIMANFNNIIKEISNEELEEIVINHISKNI